MRRVYMDANATTPLLPEVMEAMRPYWLDLTEIWIPACRAGAGARWRDEPAGRPNDWNIRFSPFCRARDPESGGLSPA